MNIKYNKDVDIAYLKFETGKYNISRELSSGVVVDLDKKGRILGFEIYDASKRLPSFIKQEPKPDSTPQAIVS